MQLNPNKFIEKIAEVDKLRDAVLNEAKEECVKLLKENPSGAFIDFWGDGHPDVESEVDCVYGTDGNDNDITITSVGLDAAGHLVFRGFDSYDTIFYDGNWCRFDKYMKIYDQIYEFIVKYLEKAESETKYPFYEYDSSELRSLDE